MKWFKNNTITGINLEIPEVGEDKPIVPLIEEMCRRDNYFHSCWMKLKAQCPHLWSQMTEVELEVAGFTYKDDNDADNDNDKPTGTVL